MLLVREIQAQNLLLLASQMTVHPVLGQHFKMRELLKHLLQSMHISSDGVLKTEIELEADMAAQAEAEANAPPDPQMVALQLEQQKLEMQAQLDQQKLGFDQQKMEMEGQLTQAEMQSKMQLSMMQIEADLTKMAAEGQITMAEVQARLQGLREQAASKERIFAAEAPSRPASLLTATAPAGTCRLDSESPRMRRRDAVTSRPLTEATCEEAAMAEENIPESPEDRKARHTPGPWSASHEHGCWL